MERFWLLQGRPSQILDSVMLPGVFVRVCYLNDRDLNKPYNLLCHLTEPRIFRMYGLKSVLPSYSLKSCHLQSFFQMNFISSNTDHRLRTLADLRQGSGSGSGSGPTLGPPQNTNEYEKNQWYSLV